MRLLDGWTEKIPLAVRLVPFDSEAIQPGTPGFQLASILEQIQRATAEARRLVLERSAQELTARLEPESWSSAECLDHLTQTTNSFLPAILTAIAAAPKFTTVRPLRTGTIASLLIRNLEPPYRLRYRVLRNLVPKEKDFDAAWVGFEESQSRLLTTVRSAAGLAIDKVKVQCPVNAHLTYNVYGAFRMLAAHERRHLWQIQQILATLDGKRRQNPTL